MIEAEIARPDSPFAPPDSPPTAKDEEIFRDTKETGVEGAYYRVTMHVKDSFEPFGPSGNDRVGMAEPTPKAANSLPVAAGGGK